MKQGNPFRNRVLTPALLVAAVVDGRADQCGGMAMSSAEGGERAGARQGAIEAIRKFRIANGFEISLFAHEPQLRNPVAFCFDERADSSSQRRIATDPAPWISGTTWIGSSMIQPAEPWRIGGR